MNARRLDPVWKALADPTRRRILDALRARPRTTGELCKPSKLSRFAVMKHLTVLEKAGLVLVRRQGRERWNHLNAIPIQQIHERWVLPYEAQWAKALLLLRTHAENPNPGAPMPSETADRNAYGVAQVELELTIDASVARVWKALTQETSAWWMRAVVS